ncbi:MAG TPA: glycosyltransferase family 1 protein, partial [Acidimicrobiaceae bacterium]|nr:glycosyltransferase family 1 protein [Acidimicrobiaceae bacterium]
FNNIAPSHDVELVLAGPLGWGVAPEELLASLDEAAKNKIRIIGEVTAAQLAALYTDASAFCYPSLLEGFGLPVLEAMSYNTPVVTSKGTATEEVAGDAALMVDPASVDEVSDALDFLLTSESEAQKLADRGYQRNKTFSWDATAAATVDVYRKLT